MEWDLPYNTRPTFPAPVPPSGELTRTGKIFICYFPSSICAFLRTSRQLAPAGDSVTFSLPFPILPSPHPPFPPFHRPPFQVFLKLRMSISARPAFGRGKPVARCRRATAGPRCSCPPNSTLHVAGQSDTRRSARLPSSPVAPPAPVPSSTLRAGSGEQTLVAIYLSDRERQVRPVWLPQKPQDFRKRLELGRG